MIYLIRILKGVLLGCTAVIPGISIGTMALVLDVYASLISALTFFFMPRRWKNKRDFAKSISFLIPIVIGIIIAMVAFSSIILLLLESNESFVRITFSGIIIGTIPHVFLHYIKPHYFSKGFSKKQTSKIFSLIILIVSVSIGFAVILLLSGQAGKIPNATSVPVNFIEMLRAFVFGIVGAAAGIIPGISGSYILLILGYYSSFLYILGSVTLALFIPLILGSLLGLVIVALEIQAMITKYPSVSYAVIFGMIIASLVSISPWDQIAIFTPIEYVIAIICLFVGIVFSYISEKLSVKFSK